ncbi:AsnC family transcriptional regulator [Tateyamaria omphalii]|uniref:Lrp/AsnC family transcriptional regulator n=1 Tax=Tateyamaria omphalii TaxID=299262 RepID=UPI001671DBAE|nr:Lrp/AsnC family transcriptional regulator [Tateyamaria omphalii]GGX49497.1 AsnC family transcriptional regulator [Tateyamaria omphalii]
MNDTLDALDQLILKELTRDARLGWSELAARAGVSAPTVRDRVRRLEDTGLIQGFVAELSPRALGYGLEAIVRFKPFPGKVHILADRIIATDRIVQCDKVTGEDAFVARMLLRDIAELDGLLEPFTAHASTQTAIVKSSPVPMRPPPLIE